MNHQHRDPKIWDVIVIGGGVAGLSAALTLGRACRRVLVLDAGEPRNRFSDHIHGLLGCEGIEPAELLRRGREELGAYDVSTRQGEAKRVVDTDGGLVVALEGGEPVRARALVLASGLTDVLAEIPGLAEQWGRSVLHCPYCHGWEVRGGRIAVLGTSPLSLHHAELIRQWSETLIFLSAGCGSLDPAALARLRARGVEVVDVPVAEVLSEDGRLVGVSLVDGARLDVDAIFTAPTARPRDGFLAELALERADGPMGSFIRVDLMGATSHPRVWAAGNVVNPTANVPISIGAGSVVGGAVNMALVGEDFDAAMAAVAGGTTGAAAQHWEAQYATTGRRWSGKVNPTLAEVVEALPSAEGATVLDLGCGEGGDAVWLAEHGWRVTAVDVSETAVRRGTEGAVERGVGDSIEWVVHDLVDWRTTERFDLVTASFLHSMIEFPRVEILRRAAGRVREGGHLVIVSHVFESPEDVPPWALRHHGVGRGDPAIQDRISDLLLPAAEVAALELDGAGWEVVISEIRQRESVGPDGVETAVVKDGVVVLRRSTDASEDGTGSR